MTSSDSIVTNSVIDAMATCRAMRYLRPDPVPDELLSTVLFAATRASSPNNSQAWTFIVVRDDQHRTAVGEAIAPFAQRIQAMKRPDDATGRRTLEGSEHLARTLGEAPVLIFVCVRNIQPAHPHGESMMWSAGFAASQNLVVAARSVGLGTVFTTLHNHGGPELRTILELPDDVHIATLIPLGWPAREFGPVSRKPLSEVVCYERFGGA